MKEIEALQEKVSSLSVQLLSKPKGIIHLFNLYIMVYRPNICWY